jgi:hypothetical protein
MNEAQEIRTLVNVVLTLPKGDLNRNMAINDIISRCHPKWLGDYYITGIDYKEWTDLITNLKTKLKKEI